MPTNNSSQNSSSTSSKITRNFEKFSEKVNDIVGSPYWFVFSIMLIVIWFPTGFIFGFGEIWHLLINSTTTILTFLMMSLLHASQSKWERKMERIQMKEKTTLNAIQQETQKIAEVGKDTKSGKEEVSSLH